MPIDDHDAARKFAVSVVRKLRDAGHEALWAGGCVRDQLLGRVPKDYDVATSARPEQIRDVFGRRWTLPIGAAFGVITVLGPKPAGQIEVATFREDAAYSDGRHPDSVSFSTAEADAQRRDFTINGLFFDPIDEQVIDYVGGQADLQRKLIRAIGDPYERIAEDKLRMLRAVRFGATFDFQIDDATMSAVQRQASEIQAVSAERIGQEIRRVFAHENRVIGATLLRHSGLLARILPEFDTLLESGDGEAAHRWQRTLGVLRELGGDCLFPLALAALLREIYLASEAKSAKGGPALVESVAHRWRLSNQETRCAQWLLAREGTIREATRTRWSTVQRILIADHVDELLDFSQAVARVVDNRDADVDFCRDKRNLPEEQLNPQPLIRGEDLMEAGIRQGPAFKRLLDETRNAQLEGELDEKAAAVRFAQSLWQRMQDE